jgi:hypothetical protein
MGGVRTKVMMKIRWQSINLRLELGPRIEATLRRSIWIASGGHQIHISATGSLVEDNLFAENNRIGKAHPCKRDAPVYSSGAVQGH